MMRIATVLVLLAISTVSCGAKETTESEKPKKRTKEDAPAAASPAPPPEPTPVELIQKATTLADAISIAKPLMSDTTNEISDGAVLFGIWAKDRLTWADLSAVTQTKQALVSKDPDSERGKRICAKGKILEIKKSGDVFEGGMFNGYGFSDLVRFIAVKSTGELVEDSRANFCGIVIGRYSYSNSGGGTTHAVYAVGMFDLPENKEPAVQK